MTKLFDLVEKEKLLPTNREARLTEQDLIDAQGLFIIGSTLDVLPVKEFEGRAIPVGPIAAKLFALLRADQPV